MYIIKHHAIGMWFNGFRHDTTLRQTIPQWTTEADDAMTVKVYGSREAVDEAMNDLHDCYSGEEFESIIVHRVEVK